MEQVRHLLRKVDELARLHLSSIAVVDNVVTVREATVMEVLSLIDTRVVVVGKRRATDARAGLNPCHVVPDGVCVDEE